MHHRLSIIILLLLCAIPAHAHAACTSPAKNTGAIIYNADAQTIQGCTPAGWKPFHRAHPSALSVPTGGLIHYWQLEENPVATPIVDEVGGANGTVTGSITSLAGVVNSAMNYNGTGRYIRTGSFSSLSGVNKFTYSAWLKRNSVNGVIGIGQENFVGSDWFVNNMEFWDDGALYFQVSGNSGSGVYGTYSSNDTNWHHVAMVFDGTLAGNANRVKAYLDGAPITLSFGGTAPATTHSQPNPFHLGSGGDCNPIAGGPCVGNKSIRGRVDEVRIYDRSLTPAEVNILYQCGLAGNCQGGCTNPAAGYGKIIYNADARVFQGCAAGGWMALHSPGSGGGGCSGPAAGSPGKIIYNADFATFQGCTADGWMAFHTEIPCEDRGPGARCLDGSVYAGLSPDGSVPMFTTPGDAGLFSWNDSSTTWSDTAMQNCVSDTPGVEASCRTGETNTSLLAGMGTTPSPAPYTAARHCNDLNVHGKDDWYLPAQDELEVLYQNRVAIGGFDLTGSLPNGRYWSSSEVSHSNAKSQRLSSGTKFDNNKNNAWSVRCVRK